jgi:hypothetical protein
MVKKLFVRGAVFFTLITVITVALSIYVSAAEINNGYLNFDQETYEVIISGYHPKGEGREVTVSVKVNKEEEPFYWRGTVTGEGGFFEFKYIMNVNSSSGRYYVRIGGAGLSPVVKEYVYLSSVDDERIKSEMTNKSDPNDVKSFFDENGDMFGIQRDEGSKFALISSAGQLKVYEALCNRSYDSSFQVLQAFEQAVAIQILNEGNPSSGAEIIDISAGDLNLNIGEGSYYNLINSDPCKQQIFSTMIGAGFNLKRVDDVTKEFEKAVRLAAINDLDVTNRNNMIEYINEFNTNGFTNISLTSFNSSSFNDLERLNIIKSVIEQKNEAMFKSLSAFKQAFEQSVISEADKKNQGDRGNISPRPSGHSVTGGTTKTIISDNTGKVPPRNDLGIKGLFDDIDNVSWAVESIQYLAERGIVSGSGHRIFEPNRNITREEFVKILVISLKLDNQQADVSFSDVKQGEWYYKYIGIAEANGLIKGIDKENFGINQSITREQLCTMIYRALNALGINLESIRNEAEFADKAQIAEYASEPIEYLYKAGIVDGMGNNMFTPGEEATRAMAAKIVYSLMERGGLM